MPAAPARGARSDDFVLVESTSQGLWPFGRHAAPDEALTWMKTPSKSSLVCSLGLCGLVPHDQMSHPVYFPLVWGLERLSVRLWWI